MNPARRSSKKTKSSSQPLITSFLNPVPGPSKTTEGSPHGSDAEVIDMTMSDEDDDRAKEWEDVPQDSEAENEGDDRAEEWEGEPDDEAEDEDDDCAEEWEGEPDDEAEDEDDDCAEEWEGEPDDEAEEDAANDASLVAEVQIDAWDHSLSKQTAKEYIKAKDERVTEWCLEWIAREHGRVLGQIPPEADAVCAYLKAKLVEESAGLFVQAPNGRIIKTRPIGAYPAFLFRPLPVGFTASPFLAQYVDIVHVLVLVKAHKPVQERVIKLATGQHDAIRPLPSLQLRTVLDRLPNARLERNCVLYIRAPGSAYGDGTHGDYIGMTIDSSMRHRAHDRVPVNSSMAAAYEKVPGPEWIARILVDFGRSALASVPPPVLHAFEVAFVAANGNLSMPRPVQKNLQDLRSWVVQGTEVVDTQARARLLVHESALALLRFLHAKVEETPHVAFPPLCSPHRWARYLPASLGLNDPKDCYLALQYILGDFVWSGDQTLAQQLAEELRRNQQQYPLDINQFGYAGEGIHRDHRFPLQSLPEGVETPFYGVSTTAFMSRETEDQLVDIGDETWTKIADRLKKI